jgi:nitronate monooxygenase
VPTMSAGLPGVPLELPVIAAPMAGGPSTPELVAAAAAAGAMGFLAGGYLGTDRLGDQIAAVRAAAQTFGVNLFAPNPLPVDPAAYARYREELRPAAERLGVDLPAEPVEDDDRWREKLDLLLTDPVPVVSFTFGIPEPAILAALRAAGTLVIQTVTNVDEGRLAAAAGVDALAVQAAGAGGHSGTLTPGAGPAAPPPPDLPGLVAAVRAATDLPVVAAGGLSDPAAVAAALGAGAAAAAVGTALLLAPEAGTNAAHRAGLLGPDRGPTVVTRAFSGRPARAAPNAFLAAHDGHAPLGYPAVHHLTGPLRRAAAAAGDPEGVNLWAGTGYRSVVERPAADTLRELASRL